MQGHRNDKHVGPALLRHVPLHMSRDQPGETLLSRIFEFERDSARNVPISQHRPRAIMRRRVGEAGAAMAWPGLFEGERQSTTLTAGRTEKIHLRPALKAKAVVLANNNATSGAARGQREIDEWDRQRAQNIHKALSYLHARCTSPAVTDAARSEEHTSELQSLMRISYAVFCLKKTKKNKYTNKH